MERLSKASLLFKLHHEVELDEEYLRCIYFYLYMYVYQESDMSTRPPLPPVLFISLLPDHDIIA